MLLNDDLYSHLTSLLSLLYLGKHGKAKMAPFKCCVNRLPEFSHLLPDFFNIAGLQFYS